MHIYIYVYIYIIYIIYYIYYIYIILYTYYIYKMSLYVVPHLPILHPKVPPVISGNLIGREPAVVLPQPWAVQSELSLNVEAAVYRMALWQRRLKTYWENGSPKPLVQLLWFLRNLLQKSPSALGHRFGDLLPENFIPCRKVQQSQPPPQVLRLSTVTGVDFPPNISGQKTSVAMGATKAKWQIPNWRDGVIYEENAQQLSQLSPAGTRGRLEDWKTVPDPNEAPSTGDW